LKISDDVGDMDLGMHKLDALTKDFREVEIVGSGVTQLWPRRGIERTAAGKPTQLHMISHPHEATSDNMFGPIIGGYGWC
jgi:hypothetical protein